MAPEPQRLALHAPLHPRRRRLRDVGHGAQLLPVPTPTRPTPGAGSSPTTTSTTRSRRPSGSGSSASSRRPPADWRWALLLGAVGIPIGIALLFIREPPKGANESSHILQAAGMDTDHPARGGAEGAPRPGRAAPAAHQVALLPARRRGHPRLRRHRHPAVRVAVLQAGLAPRPGPARPRLPAHRPVRLPRPAGRLPRRRPAASGAPRSCRSSWPGRRSRCTAGCSRCRSTCRSCGWSCCSSSSPTPPSPRCRSPSSRPWPPPRPPRCAASASACSGCTAWCSAGFAGGGPPRRHQRRDAQRDHRARPSSAPCARWAALLLVVGSRFVRQDITLVIEDVLERYAEGKRRKAGGAIPALQIHNLDFFYGTQQVLFDVNLEVARGRDRRPARHQRRRQEHAAAGRGRARPPPSRA